MKVKEPLINSESFSCAGKMRQIKAPIAGNSKVIAKIGSTELVHFTRQLLIHELIRGSLSEMVIQSFLNCVSRLLIDLDGTNSDCQ